MISNVPGPRSSLYCAGAELTANYPLSVIVDGVGLNITVVSYKNRVDFGIVGDREQIDDAWSFLEGAAHALQELENLKEPGALNLRSGRVRSGAEQRVVRTGSLRERILKVICLRAPVGTGDADRDGGPVAQLGLLEPAA